MDTIYYVNQYSELQNHTKAAFLLQNKQTCLLNPKFVGHELFRGFDSYELEKAVMHYTTTPCFSSAYNSTMHPMLVTLKKLRTLVLVQKIPDIQQQKAITKVMKFTSFSRPSLPPKKIKFAMVPLPVQFYSPIISSNLD